MGRAREGMKFLEALRNASEGLRKEIADSKLFEHSGLRGEFREFAVERLLRPHLPKACGLGRGEVFDQSGRSSRQLDVILYDALFGNVLFSDQASSLFCRENVYGVTEVNFKCERTGKGNS